MAQEGDGAVGLVATVERAGRGLQRIERRLHMRHVHGGNAASGNDESEPLAPDETVLIAFFLHARAELVTGRLFGFVDILQDDHLGPKHRTVGRLPAGEARLPDQCGVAACVHKAGSLDVHVAVACCELKALHPTALDLNAPQYRAKRYGDAGLANRLLDPAGQCDLVVVDHCGQRSMPVIERMLFRAEIAQDVVGDAVGELVAVGAVGEQPAERADDRIDRLAAEHGQAVDQHDFAPGPGGGQCGGGAGDPRTHNANIRLDAPRGGVWLARDDLSIRRNLGIHLRFRSLIPRCIRGRMQRRYCIMARQ